MAIPNTFDSLTSSGSSTPAMSIPIHIPLCPPIRSAASVASTSSRESSSSSVHLSERPVTEVTLRHGRVEDAPLLTDMQFSNYLYHYRGFASKAFFENMDHAAMTAHHIKRMTPPMDKREMAYIVAERKDPKTGELEIVGMSQATVPWWDRAYNYRFNEGWSQDDFDCEVDTVYVKIGVQGGGIGRKVVLGAMQEGYDRLNMRRGIIIWTPVQNYQAGEFYKRIGCLEMARKTLDLGGVPCEYFGYAFRSVGEAIGK
ncbi:hypothetical protein BGZ58_007104 [Dissophora ornata]|nr:hypothetical protein BGZ58_007104 [Dissophora ornata]